MLRKPEPNNGKHINMMTIDGLIAAVFFPVELGIVLNLVFYSLGCPAFHEASMGSLPIRVFIFIDWTPYETDNPHTSHVGVFFSLFIVPEGHRAGRFDVGNAIP